MSDETSMGDNAGTGETAGVGPESPFSVFGALGDLGDMLERAREQLEEVAEEAASKEVVGTSGSGQVEVRLNGNLEAVSVRIAPEVVDPSDVALLEDLVLAALRAALEQVATVREDAATSLMPPGVDLSSMMEGLFGNTGRPGTPDIGAALPDVSELMGKLFSEEPGTETEPDGPDDSP